jgi:hypothetical protein
VIAGKQANFDLRRTSNAQQYWICCELIPKSMSALVLRADIAYTLFDVR